jgi:hypothetical protein
VRVTAGEYHGASSRRACSHAAGASGQATAEDEDVPAADDDAPTARRPRRRFGAVIDGLLAQRADDIDGTYARLEGRPPASPPAAEPAPAPSRRRSPAWRRTALRLVGRSRLRVLAATAVTVVRGG